MTWAATADGRWRPADVDDHPDGHHADGHPAGGEVRPVLGVTALDRWLAAHAVRPLALATPDAVHGERLALVSAAGTLGWRPPLERLSAAADVDGGRPALRRAALRLRTLADATEQHAVDAVERYARAAAAAARVARLLDAPALDTVGVTPGLFVAVEALVAAGLRTLAAAEALAADVFGRGLLAAPATLRAVLLDVRAAHAAPAAARRRALLRHAAAGLGPPSVRVRRLTVAGGSVWAVRVPVGAAALATVDALAAGWDLATEAWRAVALVAYAAAGAWAFD